jgi:hypothetical protein
MLQLCLCHSADAHRATDDNNQSYVMNAGVTQLKGVTSSEPGGHKVLMGAARPPPGGLASNSIDIQQKQCPLSAFKQNAKVSHLSHEHRRS